jgi:hypothetical protein
MHLPWRGCSGGGRFVSESATGETRPKPSFGNNTRIRGGGRSEYEWHRLRGGECLRIHAINAMRALEIIVLPYTLSGFGVGFVVGLTGVGGGSPMTPLLVLLFGFHPATAVGTDLLYASVTKTCGTAVHHIGQTVEWRVVGWLGTGSLPESFRTLLLISRQPHSSSSAVASLISYVLGYALLLSALSLLFRRRIFSLAHVLSLHREAAKRSRSGCSRGRVTWRAGVVIVGRRRRNRGHDARVALPHLPIARIIGTDIAHAVPLTLVAGLGARRGIYACGHSSSRALIGSCDREQCRQKRRRTACRFISG